MDTIIYRIGSKAYINLTNKCSNNCDFCVRKSKEKFNDYYLWLEKEPTAEEVVEKVKDFEDCGEFVFCGFGEPLYKLDNIIEIANYLKQKGKKTRINTNGQAGLICGENTAKRIKGKIDVISISLNASNAKEYQKICHSIFGEKGFYAMLDFAKECHEQGTRTIFSIVDSIGKDEIEGCKELAEKLNIELRIRKYIEI